MAKSIKSKWRKKMRAIKRVKNTPKEQARLLRILPKEGEKFEELYTVKKIDKKPGTEQVKAAAEEAMEVGEKAVFDAKTLKNEHGQYPEWMNQRGIKKRKKAAGKAKVKKGKKSSQW